MCAGGCFCSVKTKLCSEALKNGGKSKEMEEEGRRRIAFAACSRRLATCLPLVVRRPLTLGLVGLSSGVGFH